MHRHIALDAFAKLELEGANLQLAQYWLSICNGDRLPKRRDFVPGRIPHLLPGIGLFEVRPGESARCRLAGSALVRAIGGEITGLDWREYTPRSDWASRLRRNSEIARGSVGVGIRYDGEERRRIQEIQLPFDDQTDDGARLILFHLAWQPLQRSTGKPKESPSAPVADEFVSIPLSR